MGIFVTASQPNGLPKVIKQDSTMLQQFGTVECVLQ